LFCVQTGCKNHIAWGGILECERTDQHIFFSRIFKPITRFAIACKRLRSLAMPITKSPSPLAPSQSINSRLLRMNCALVSLDWANKWLVTKTGWKGKKKAEYHKLK
jgi:hypothetical protein